ncbi:Metallo-dependent phosphatase [Lentinus tigrinus ALCF2SS1-6]|uniref:Metallo-dependent phosphatase n=1 Tax=Lentinus tigrinus ALCF2SS1-6 TaxID=1328759 RepID=A0A5C2SB64_9APHY|nr:Metallo-dependent phosphatase [Lentinus tigrinus ALCF2SS1-6]
MRSQLDPDRITLWEEFLHSPMILLARLAHEASSPQPPALLDTDDPQTEASSERARIVCISDTHNHQAHLPPLPPGDVLIHAGDLTSTGTAKELDAAFAWLHAAPHPHKIVIAGNHDHGLSKPERRAQLLEQYPSITYLEDKLTTIEIRGRLLSIYGSPHTPHHEPGAFNYVRGQSGQWALPAFVDILVTHGPPLDHLDGRRNGCAQLRNAVRLLRPQLHVFGHVHSGRGVKCVTWDEAQRRYESIISVNRRKRFVWTLGLVAAAVGAKIRGRPKFRHGAHTMLVNASAQGWFRDNVWRGATVVDIPLQHPHRSL